MLEEIHKDNAKRLMVELERVLSADESAHKRYLYHQGALYRRDKDSQVQIVHADLPLVDWYDLVTIACDEANPMELWAAFGPHGLYYSQDGGEHFAVLEGVVMAEAVWLAEVSDEGELSSVLMLQGRLEDGRVGRFYSLTGGTEWFALYTSSRGIQSTTHSEWDLTIGA